MEKWHAPPVRNRLEPPPHSSIAAWTWEKSPGQGAIVEPRTADENREASARVDLADRSRRVACVLCGSVFGRRIHDVEEMMRDAPAICEQHFIGPDVEAAIDCRRIAVHDLAAKPLGERQGERALARRSRTQHGD